eukprot:477723_1
MNIPTKRSTLLEEIIQFKPQNINNPGTLCKQKQSLNPTQNNNALFFSNNTQTRCRLNMKKLFQDKNIDKETLSLFDNNCYYFPSFFKETQQNLTYKYLKNDVKFAINDYKSFKSTNLGSKHETIIMYDSNQENNISNSTYSFIMNILIEYFDVEVIHAVLNHYSDNKAFVPLHKDYYYKGMDITIGASFGEERIFQFTHPKEKDILSIPQKNGDVIAFTKHVNNIFQHGILPTSLHCGPKFSVILFAKRKNLNERNSSLEERKSKIKNKSDNAFGVWMSFVLIFITSCLLCYVCTEFSFS